MVRKNSDNLSLKAAEEQVKQTNNNSDEDADVSSWTFEQKYPSFEAINRKEENKDIIRFQKTSNKAILEKLYHNRVPTLQVWARRYCYLHPDKKMEDMFSELTQVFIRAIHRYKKRKQYKIGRKTVWRQTHFNTYLWSCLDHFVKNLRSRNEAIKRTTEKFSKNFVLSLDYKYSNKKDGTENTLKDILKNELSTGENTKENLYLEETLDVLAHENPHIKNFLKKLSDGNTLAALLRQYRIKEGTIKIKLKDASRLKSRRRCNRIVADLISDATKIQDSFQVLNYEVILPNKLHYTIEMKKTKVTNSILREIRKLRKNKETILTKIHGERPKVLKK